MGKYRIAFYLRLSKEEGLSIRSQRLLLQKFAEKNFTDYEISEFCDNGYTGTNFSRPGVQRLLKKVKASEIDCIIVKDFSRFARDYIELGAYLEQIFPVLGVRFISVNDYYDSEKCRESTPDMNVKFKSLLYDLYSKDISQKVRSSLNAKKDAGQYVSANIPFGYKRSSECSCGLAVDEDEAQVVRRIFYLALNGCTSSQIARYFNETGVKTPAVYRIEKGEIKRKPKGGSFFWSSSSVCHILKNEFYIGHAVQKKYAKSFSEEKSHLKPSCDWQVIYNHHTPIIEKEVFEKIRARSCSARKSAYKKNSPQKTGD